MRGFVPTLLLTFGGCTDGTPVPAGTPTGQVRLWFTAPPKASVALEDLELALQELIIEGRGPSSDESVSVLLDRRIEPLADDAPIRFDLERGTHQDLTLTVRIGSTDGPGLTAAGSVDLDDGPRPLQIVVEGLELTFHHPSLVVGEEPVGGQIAFDLAAWGEVVRDHSDDDDGDGSSDDDDDDDGDGDADGGSDGDDSADDDHADGSDGAGVDTTGDTGDETDGDGVSDTGSDDTGQGPDDTGTGDTGTDGDHPDGGDDTGDTDAPDGGDDDGDDDDGDDDIIYVSPDSGPAHEALIEAIVDSTRLTIDPSPDAR